MDAIQRLDLNAQNLKTLLPLLTECSSRGYSVSYETRPNQYASAFEFHVIFLHDNFGQIENFYAFTLQDTVKRASEFMCISPCSGDFSTCKCSECRRIAKSWDEYNENRRA